MALASGGRLGSYEVVSAIGSGGMGEVYRARDTKLHRDVALKILPEEFAADPERRARFEREARTLASLNHPHIAQIYGVEDSGTTHALVMELVEGPTLADRIAQGPIALDETLSIARQIASALGAAHEAGVVHRDVKPANVKVRPDGAVKVLDFGLAKALAPAEVAHVAGSALANSPTVASPAHLTGAGILLGTAAYMSPEQAKGKPVNRRADVWAFGTVLYEMLTGRTLFAGETMTDVLAAIVKEAPDWSALPAATPPAIRRLLRRSLEKDPARRLDSLAAARLEIDEAMAGTAEDRTEAASESARSRTMMLSGAALLAGALIGGAAIWALRPQDTIDAPLRKYVLTVEGQLDPLISPDATKLAYVLKGQLWIRDLDRLTPRTIPGAERVENLFWSPDSQWVGFSTAKKLWKVAVAGETPTVICDLPETGSILGAAWASDGTIAFSAWHGSLYEVSSSGGDPTRRLALNPDTEVDFHYPHYLGDRRDLLIAAHPTTGALDRIELVSDGARKTLITVADGGSVSGLDYASGHLLYVRSGTNAGLWAVPFSASRSEVAGEPFRVMSEAASISAASDNTLVMTQRAESGPSELVWVDRDGLVAGTAARALAGLMQPALSPDGTRVAAAVAGLGHDICVIDLESGSVNRLTSDAEDDHAPMWSPDGRRIVFYRSGSAEGTLVGTTPALSLLTSIAADGTGGPRTLTAGGAPTFAPDGRTLAYIVKAEPVVSTIRTDGTLEPPTPLGKVTDAREGRVSPDGRFYAYSAIQAGELEVFITQFPDGGGRWQISNAGGRTPRWSRTSGELFYVTGSGTTAARVMAVPVRAQPTLSLGSPLELFDPHAAGIDVNDGFDVSPDGKRILGIRRSSASDDRVHVIIVHNWIREFEKDTR